MKTLSTLLDSQTQLLSGSAETAIEDIVFDSRKVKPGCLFVALRGVHQDAHAHVPAAVQAGARAVVVDHPMTVADAAVVQVPDTLKALATLSAKFWGFPSRSLRMVGITGTNGKTTSSYLVEAIFAAAGWNTGVMGTINYRFGASSTPAPNTTPFASDLQRFLASVRDGGGQACVMEVSSHALELNRVEGVEFDTALFTNLTQDHLDFHKTMEAYGAAKAKLFTSLNAASTKTFPKMAVINADDPWSEKMVAGVRVPVWRFRLHGHADIFAKNLTCDATGSRFELHTPKGFRGLTLPLLGEYNVMNALGAAGAALSQGVPLETIIKGLEGVKGVPGRMERIASPRGFTVVVDYAHTDDALRQVMTALRRLRPERLITVFGCGGDRDRAKRPLMGEAAARMSDEVIVTSDNPRSEEPEKITLDVEIGVRRVRSDHYKIILDREAAIHEAFRRAKKGDIVLIAGKGHENYQIMADRTIPFDDREVAQRLLSTLK